MPTEVEVGDDRLHPPVPVAVDDVAGVALRQQLGVVARVLRPLPLPRPDPDRRPLHDRGGGAAARRRVVLRRWRRDDVAGVEVAEHGERTRPLRPQPGEVGAEHRVDLVLQHVEVHQTPGGREPGADRRPGAAGGEPQHVDGLEQREQSLERRPAVGEGALLVRQDPAEAEQPDHAGMGIHLEAEGSLGRADVPGVDGPAVPLGQSQPSGRVHPGPRPVGGVRAGVEAGVHLTEQALRLPPPGRVGHDQRRVDPHTTTGPRPASQWSISASVRTPADATRAPEASTAASPVRPLAPQARSIPMNTAQR